MAKNACRTTRQTVMELEDDGLDLEYVPYELRTKEICEIAVTENGHALGFVPEGVMTIELCEIAVRESGEYLYYVPEQFRTFELCEIAVKDSGSWAIEFVPKEDEKVKGMLQNREDIFDQYSLAGFKEAFAGHFEILREEIVGNTTRVLLLMKPK